MAVTTLFLLGLHYSTAFVLEDNIFKNYNQEPTLRLPTEYHFKGDVTSLDYGIIRPFEIWYSARHNRSRKDTYGGLVTRYYYGDRRRLYMIHPTATNELVSKTICTAEKTDEKLKNFLPSLTSEKFKHSGETLYDNKLVDVWEYSSAGENDHQTVAQLLVERGAQFDIPILWEKTEVSRRNGLVVNHFITRYYDFQDLNVEDITYDQAEEHCVLDEMTDSELHPGPSDVVEAFRRYKNNYNKKYADVDEEDLRALIFKRNLRLVTEHNSRNVSYKLALNKFSDRLTSELAHLSATRPGNPRAPGSHPFPLTTRQLEKMTFRLPRNYDMRIDGTISAVKEQADCGSCYAFATVAAVEGALAKRNATWNLDLSEQSVVDCSWSEKNHGCGGGYLHAALQHVQLNGIPTEMEYGIYLAEDGVCKYNIVTKVTRIKGFTRVVGGSLAMKAVLYNYGPVASSINAMEDLKFYESGIYYNPDCNKNGTNHAVTVVGYGERDGAPYWIVKNSWGEEWGQAGYMFLSAENNNCRILDEAFFVTL